MGGNNKLFDLYHGSCSIIEQPIYGYGNADNDYGLGFYCTEDIELGREWACSEQSTAWCNHYVLSDANLKILDLTEDGYSELNWLALLVNNRNVSYGNEVARLAAKWLIDNYLIDISDYDIVVGYRADDAFFAIARAFVNNTLPLEILEQSLRKGDLGIQIVLKTPAAFDALQFVNVESVDQRIYGPRRRARSEQANAWFFNKVHGDMLDGTFIRDLIRNTREK